MIGLVLPVQIVDGETEVVSTPGRGWAIWLQLFQLEQVSS